VANTYELKQISLAHVNTDKIDANILSRILKMQVLGKEHAVSPVVVPLRTLKRYLTRRAGKNCSDWKRGRLWLSR
jgi:hypothetical protein